jgi:hypothetical protein
MSILQRMSDTARTNLRTRMHKVAAVMAAQDGTPLANDEVTIKEAAYLLGRRFWLHRLEKRAMFDGILSLRQLRR